MFSFISASDAQAAIAAANYFSPVVVDLNVGDLIYAVDSTNVSLQYEVTAKNNDAKTVTVAITAAAGDVVGPAAATDNALVRFDGATGKLIQNGVVLESDLGDLTLVRSIANGAGLLATPSYTFTGDLDSGMWHSGANTVDFSTNAFRSLQLAASPALSVNYTRVTASSTGNPVLISAAGTDANIGIGLIPVGTGAVQGPVGAVATPGYAFTGDVDTGMWHSAANTIDFSTNALRGFQIDASPAVAVDFLSVKSAATGAVGLPLIQAKGTDADVDVGILPQGAGGLSVRGATNAGTLKLWNQANTFYAGIRAAAMAASITWVWPQVDATVAGQAIVSDAAGNLSFSAAVPGTETWIDQTTTPVAVVANAKYISDAAGLVTFNMPAVIAQGSIVEVAGNGAGGWLIQMNAGQTANSSAGSTSVGGSLASSNRYDCIKLLCVTANTTFTVVTSSGAITNA